MLYEGTEGGKEREEQRSESWKEKNELRGRDRRTRRAIGKEELWQKEG